MIGYGSGDQVRFKHIQPWWRGPHPDMWYCIVLHDCYILVSDSPARVLQSFMQVPRVKVMGLEEVLALFEQGVDAQTAAAAPAAAGGVLD
jgi:hypothetical protein